MRLRQTQKHTRVIDFKKLLSLILFGVRESSLFYTTVFGKFLAFS